MRALLAYRAAFNMTLGVALTAVLLLAAPAWAHKASDAYLLLTQRTAPPAAVASAALAAPPASAVMAAGVGTDTFDLRLSLALKDLDAAIPTLDANDDRQLTWGEIKQALPAITRWVGNGARFQCGGQNLPTTWQLQSLEQRSDGAYVRLAATLKCPANADWALDYRLLAGIDPTHRLLLAGSLAGQPVAAVLAPQGRSALVLRPANNRQAGASGQGAPAQAPGLTDADSQGGGASAAGAPSLPASGWQTLQSFFAEGLHHLVTGYDHLAFLLALLLPIQLLAMRPAASLQRSASTVAANSTPANPTGWSGLWQLVRTVTGFTIGHSVTLILATLGWIAASPDWVEPAIAITIAIAAVLNLIPAPRLRGDALALGFGLIHGLGFSGVMTESGVTGSLLVWGLAGFNLGVEAGQLMGGALWCVFHLLLARRPWYHSVVVRGGSWALLALSLYWVGQRLLA